MPSYDDTFAALWSRIRELEAIVANMGNAPAPPFGRDATPGGLPVWRYAKLDGALAAAGSATASLYFWNGSAWTDSTINQTVYAPPLLSSGSIATGKWIRIAYCLEADRWEVVSAEC